MRFSEAVSNAISKWENQTLETVVQYGTTLPIFVLLYLGQLWFGAAILVGSFVITVLLLFFTASIISVLGPILVAKTVNVNWTLKRSVNDRYWDTGPKIIRPKATVLRMKLWQFTKQTLPLLLLVSFAIIGIARAAHVLNTSSYRLVLEQTDASVVIDEAVIFSAGTRGILLHDGLGGPVAFIPYDAGFVATKNKDQPAPFYTNALEDSINDSMESISATMLELLERLGKVFRLIQE